MRGLFACALLFGLAAASVGASGAESVQKMRVRQDGYDLRVEADTRQGRIRLYRLGSPEPLPNELSLKLMQSDGVVREVTLEALQPAAAGRETHSGSLGFSQLPVIGLELRFGISAGRLQKTLRWQLKPLDRASGG